MEAAKLLISGVPRLVTEAAHGIGQGRQKAGADARYPVVPSCRGWQSGVRRESGGWQQQCQEAQGCLPARRKA